jgi:hypothetical protein
MRIFFHDRRAFHTPLSKETAEHLIELIDTATDERAPMYERVFTAIEVCRIIYGDPLDEPRGS